MLAYIERIAVFIIVEGIFLRLTANEDYKKMIKICCGMILLIIVLSPLDEIFGFTGLVTEFLQEITGESKAQELREVFEMSDEKNIEQVRKEYEQVMADSLKNIADEYNYEVKDVRVVFDDTRENYIGSVSVYLSEKSDNVSSTDGTYKKDDLADDIEAIEKIEPVRVNAEREAGFQNENLNSENKNDIEAPDIIAIKNSIVDTYGIDYEIISIYTS